LRARKGQWLSIPPGWLCYLPPEVIVRLRVGNQPAKDLPFSFASDVYSFGYACIWAFSYVPQCCKQVS